MRQLPQCVQRFTSQRKPLLNGSALTPDDSRNSMPFWMFASSPALSTLQHPVYDVWAVDCKNAKS